jgi:RNA polymerase sigma-70 factor (ECF subfamily)
VSDVHDAALRNNLSRVESHGVDAPGFDEFFRAEQPRMVALAIALTGVPEVARDLAQESLVKAYRAWPSVRTMDRPGAWLRRVTINAAMSWHRSNRREAAARSRLRAPRATESPEREGERFWEAVRALPERQRAAVALHYLEDLSIADVALALDIAEGTVKASLFKARATLASALGASVRGGE